MDGRIQGVKKVEILIENVYIKRQKESKNKKTILTML